MSRYRRSREHKARVCQAAQVTSAAKSRRPLALRRRFLLLVVIVDTVLVGTLLHKTDVNLHHGVALYPVYVPFGVTLAFLVALALVLDLLGKRWDSR